MATIEQDVVDNLSRKVSETYVGSEFPELDISIIEPGVDHKPLKAGFMSKLFIQQNLIRLIATFLGLMLLVLILILLKKDPEPELSDKKISNIYVLVDQDLSSDSGIAEKRLPRELST